MAREGLLGEQGEEGYPMVLHEFGHGTDSPTVWDDGGRGMHTGHVACLVSDFIL